MKQLVLNALVAMEAIGLNLYRKSVNADLVTLWARALTLREVNPEFIAPAVDFFMAHAKDFPKPCEFADKCLLLERNSRPAIELKPAAEDVQSLPRRKILTRAENMARIKAAESKCRMPSLPDYPSAAETDAIRSRQIREVLGS